MRSIWKYPLKVTSAQDIEMPDGARILSVQMQGEQPCLWAEVDPNQVRERRKFFVAATGGPAPERAQYLGTFQNGAFVGHVYESIA